MLSGPLPPRTGRTRGPEAVEYLALWGGRSQGADLFLLGRMAGIWGAVTRPTRRAPRPLASGPAVYHFGIDRMGSTPRFAAEGR